MQLKTKERCALKSSVDQSCLIFCAERVSRGADAGVFDILVSPVCCCWNPITTAQSKIFLFKKLLRAPYLLSNNVHQLKEVLRGHKIPKIERIPHTWMRDLPKSIRVIVHERRTDQK
jgi:hypothetical protein